MKSKITATLSALLIFSLLFSTGCSKKNEQTDAPTTTEAFLQEDLTDNADAPVPEENESQSSTTLPEESTSDVSQDDTSTTTATTAVNTVPKTTEEIVAFFNQSANRIKTEATKVVKNYEKRQVNDDKTVLPKGLEDTAEDLLKKYMGDDTEPIVYSTREDIRNEYIVPEQDYVSKLQPSTVVKALCVDKGSTYEFYFKLKDQKNPRAGNGIGACCDVIEVHEVSEKVSFIKRFDTYYYNCEIRATIDKETGRVTHATYRTPLVLDLTVNLFGTHDAAVGFTFEKDYTISY